MRITRKTGLVAVILCVAAVGVYFIWKGQPNTEAKGPRNPAQVIKSGVAERKTVAVTVLANGYVTPFNTVEVRPQIQNIVRAVHVKEGQEVRAGQLLFTLDQRNDAANLDRAEAQVARDRADLANAEADLKRNQELLAKNFVSSAVVDAARAKAEALRNTVRADLAAAQSGKIVLSYNRITASISGRLGAINVHEGSLAQPSGTPLVTIAQLEPIAISFAVPERELTYIRSSYPNGDAPVAVQLPEGREVADKLFFIDNTVDTQSGAIRMKAQFDNKDRKLWPGTFINVRLTSRVLHDAVVIPVQSIVTGPTDQFVYVVQPDETVKMQKISVINIDKAQASVSGLAIGTRIVIEGTQNLRPGAKVKEMQAQPASEAGGKRARPAK